MRTTKQSYCCDNQSFHQYYKNQAGSGLPGFQGTRIQRGYGIGSMISGLFRAAAPLLKKAASTIGKQALRSGVNVASNYLSDPKKSLKHHLKDEVTQVRKKVLGSGSRGRKGIKRRASEKKFKKSKRHKPDIFDY